ILDNASMHRSHAFGRKRLEWLNHRVLVIHLSAYSPEPNLIEILWRRIRYSWLPLTAYKSFATLCSEVSRVLERFDERPERAGGDFGGEFAIDQLFSGPMAFFGGVEYQTPWDPLILQLEYEGNDYSNEPRDNPQIQETRVNLGARLAVADNLSLHGGWQRGDTAMGGISYDIDPAGLGQVKNDPEPLPIGAAPFDDWEATSQALTKTPAYG
ncbi:YjbH domain-containing protein, partial [Halomonas sp. TRM85114]|uniref:YjbH domain-containing protein n=1 Tax=Halomonas jincaotanensis TaxID=2810616 RepID=UPI001BD6A16D